MNETEQSWTKLNETEQSWTKVNNDRNNTSGEGLKALEGKRLSDIKKGTRGKEISETVKDRGFKPSPLCSAPLKTY